MDFDCDEQGHMGRGVAEVNTSCRDCDYVPKLFNLQNYDSTHSATQQEAVQAGEKIDVYS